jgi:hypothetical protein
MKKLYRVVLLAICAGLGACATPLLNQRQQQDFDEMSMKVLSAPPTSNSLDSLKVDSEIDRTRTITVKLIPGAQVFELPTGKSFVHLMKLPNYDKPYDVKLHLPTEESVLSLLPSVLILDEQFNTVNRMDLSAEDFQWAIGTTIFQEVTADPKTARYALIYTKPADFGKEFKLSIDVGISSTSYRKLLSPVGSVNISLVKKGCKIFSCELPAPNYE